LQQHPAKQAAQVQLVARDTAQQLGADRPTTVTHSVVRIMDLVLWMIIAVMGIFVWTGFVQGLDEIGKGKGDGKGIGRWRGLSCTSGSILLFRNSYSVFVFLQYMTSRLFPTL
jgi:hypothetical protein